jgi:hypothetical protein
VEVEDRERVAGLVGCRVEVAIKGEEEEGAAGLVGTLDEVRDDGIALSEISDLGSGPTLFCPWRSLRRVRDRLPWFMPPHGEELEPGEPTPGSEYYEIYESRQAAVEEITPEPPPERREASARTLERVVPVAQKRTVGGITVALTSLELYGDGVGILRWRISHDPVSGNFMLEPDFEIRDGAGAVLPWSPQGAGASDREADGEIEIRRLPEAGELWIKVSRVASGAWDGEEGGPSYDGPWIFRFTT